VINNSAPQSQPAQPHTITLIQPQANSFHQQNTTGFFQTQPQFVQSNNFNANPNGFQNATFSSVAPLANPQFTVQHQTPNSVQYSAVCDQCRQNSRICNGTRPCENCLRSGMSHMCSLLYSNNGIPQQVNGIPQQLVNYAQPVQLPVFPTNSTAQLPLNLQAAQKPLNIPSHNNTRLNMQNIMEDIRQLKSVVSSLQHRILEASQQQASPTIPSRHGSTDLGNHSSSSDASDWDIYDPDFFQKQNDNLNLPGDLDVGLLAESVWSPLGFIANDDGNTAPRPASVVPHHELPESSAIRLDGYSDTELARMRHALDLLHCFGITLDHRPKIELYAQVVSHKSVIKTCNEEFCELVRGKREDVLGRCIRDFTPRAFDQWQNFMFQRELLASGKSSVIFETVLARLDGTIFKCFNSVQVFYDTQGRLTETLLSIQLSTVTDLKLPPLPGGLPRTEPFQMPDLDYPDSPITCLCDDASKKPPAKKARIKE
jgi:PAS domain-containing protein